MKSHTEIDNVYQRPGNTFSWLPRQNYEKIAWKVTLNADNIYVIIILILSIVLIVVSIIQIIIILQFVLV